MKKILILSTSTLMLTIFTLEKGDIISRDQPAFITESKENRENEMFYPTGVIFPGDIEDEEIP